MKPISRTLRSRISLAAAIVLVMSLSLVGSAWADGIYPPDGTKPDGPGAYRNPDDGICVVGIKLDGTMLIDYSIKNYKDCDAWTESAPGLAGGTVDLVGMNTQTSCETAGSVGPPANDGYRHKWSTSLCYDTPNTKGISRVDLDNTAAMCTAKGGTVVTSGKCVAYGWFYLNRKTDGTLPIPAGTGLVAVAAADGPENPADGLGFCYTTVNLTGGGADAGTYTSSATCPSFHNSYTTAPGEWLACASSPNGCQTQESYDKGLGWSWTDKSPVTAFQCRYSYGIIGNVPAAITNVANGTTAAANALVDLTGAAYDTMGECLAAGFSWDNWLPDTPLRVDVTSATPGYEGMPTGTPAKRIKKLDALTDVDHGGGDFLSGTGAVCQKCHSDQSRGYAERDKPGFPETRHKLAGDAIGKPFQPYFTTAGSNWGLQGVQCAMCHSTSRPASDDLIQVQPAGVVANDLCTGVAAPWSCCTGMKLGTCISPNAGDPKSASGHNNTEYGSQLLDICYTCHGTAATPVTTNPASVIPSTTSDFTLTGYGLAPITNQFLNSPHAKYTGSSSKIDIGNESKYSSPFAGWICRSAATTFRSSPGVLPGQDSGTCVAAGHTWYTGISGSSKCYYDADSCAAVNGTWTSTFDTSAYSWAVGTNRPNNVCYGVGLGAILTTYYRNGEAHKIHFLDSTTNSDCTNYASTTSTSGASGYWLRDGETTAGSPAFTDQGTCMTCHDIHWALASTEPHAEPLRRECTTCHSHSGLSATGAPQVNLATINHVSGAGTPIEDPSHPDAACESCHMPKSSATGSYMHLWRINTDPNYVTLGAAQANNDLAGEAWVDLDHACGKCHGGGTAMGPGYMPVPPAPYATRAELAIAAEGMHSSPAQNYAVTFTTAVSGLTANVNATVNCGAWDPNNPDTPDPTCPTGMTYEWHWGHVSANGSGDTTSHLYPTPVCVAGPTPGAVCNTNATCGVGGSCALKYAITLTVKLSSGQQVGAPVTQGIILNPPDLPPVAGTTFCGWELPGPGVSPGIDTWTWVVIDNSTDAPSAPPSVVIDWGDGTRSSVAAGGTKKKVYTRVGSFPIKVTALDTKGQSHFVTCGPAAPAYFTIGGTVTNSLAAVVPGALVTLKKRAANGTWVNVGTASTSATGTYLFSSIKPARYSITVTKTGFTFPLPIEFSAGPNQTKDVSSTSPRPVIEKNEGMDNAN